MEEVFASLDFPPSDARLQEEYEFGQEIKNREEIGAFIINPEGLIKVIIHINIRDKNKAIVEEFKLKKVGDLPPPEEDPIVKGIKEQMKKEIKDVKEEIVDGKTQSQEQTKQIIL